MQFPDADRGPRPDVRPAVRRGARVHRIGEQARVARASEPVPSCRSTGGATWYRYHRTFRELPPRRARARASPISFRALNERAAAWCEANGAPEAAISHARSGRRHRPPGTAGQQARAPDVLRGRVATVEAWLGWFDDTSSARAATRRSRVLGSLGASSCGAGRATAKRWLGATERSELRGKPVRRQLGRSSPWIAVLRAAMCRDGVERMRADAEIALRDLGASSAWRPAALLLHGVAQLLLGADDQGETRASPMRPRRPSSAGATDVRGRRARRAVAARDGARETTPRPSALAAQARAPCRRGAARRATRRARSPSRRLRGIALRRGDQARREPISRGRTLSRRSSRTRSRGTRCRRASSSDAPISRCSTRRARERGWRPPPRSSAADRASASSEREAGDVARRGDRMRRGAARGCARRP